MKPLENQNREIPEMGTSFDKTIFKRQVADLLRQNKPQEVNYYADEMVIFFPEESQFILNEVSRLLKQRMKLLGIPDPRESDPTPLSDPDVRYFG